jgi:GntR family transcriptional regulator
MKKEAYVIIDETSSTPIFLQIAQGIEDAILSGAFPEESRIPSITEFSVNFRINPATALKGVSLLCDEEILYKKRGLGMFVCSGAVEKLRAKRRRQFYDGYVLPLCKEAKRLEIEKDGLISLIERGYEDEH